MATAFEEIIQKINELKANSIAKDLKEVKREIDEKAKALEDAEAQGPQ